MPMAVKSLNLKQQLAECGHSWIEDILEEPHKFPSLGTIQHYRGRDKAQQVIMTIISEAMDQLSVQRGFNEKMLFTCAEWILGDNKNLTIADLKLCLKMGIRGDFGAIYDRFDTNVVLTWINEYWEKRLSLSAERKVRIHESLKEKRT